MIGKRPRARFCHSGCADSFRGDRQCGLIYGSVRAPEGIYTHEQFSLLSGCCAYCGARVTAKPRVTVKPRWPAQ